MFSSPNNLPSKRTRAATPSSLRNSPARSTRSNALNPTTSNQHSFIPANSIPNPIPNPTPKRRNVGARNSPFTPYQQQQQQGLEASTSLLHQQDSEMLGITHQTGHINIANISQQSELNSGDLLSRDDILSVRASSRIPIEVAQVLNGIDLNIDPIYGEMDVETGFSFLVTRSACHVWNFNSFSPMCYTFPLPTLAKSNSLTLPFCCLIPRNDKEPGLLVVLPEGQVRLWETLASSIGMSIDEEDSGSSFQKLAIPLGIGEEIVALVRCEAKSYALSTTHSRIFKVTLHSSSGRIQMNFSSFPQQRGLISRLFGSAPVPTTSSLIGSNSSFGKEGLFSLSTSSSSSSSNSKDRRSTIANPKESSLLAISSNSIQLWKLQSQSGGERLVCEMDLKNLIEGSEIFLDQVSNLEGSSNGIGAGGLFGNRISIEDSKILKNDQVSILFSIDEKKKIGIAVLHLAENVTPNVFVVRSVRFLRDVPAPDPRPYSTPKLCIPNGGPAAFVVFPEAIVSLILEQDGDFEEFISLKRSTLNRFLGVGFEPVEYSHHQSSPSTSNLKVLTLKSGPLDLDFNFSRANEISLPDQSLAERRSLENERLRIKLDQAISFGSNPLNPLAFGLGSNFKGDLQKSCEELSYQLVISDSDGLDGFANLEEQIRERVERMKRLMEFLNENNVMGKLSQSTRRQLRSDAERVAAAGELWHYQNEYIDSPSNRNTDSPLVVAIKSVMSEIGQGFGSDVVREFFKSELPRLGNVQEQLLKIIKSSAGESLERRSMLVKEVSEIALTLFQAAAKFRREHGGLYRIDDSPSSFEAWTAEPIGIDLFENLFSMTESIIKDRSREFGSVVDQVRNDYVDDTEVEDLQTRRQRLQQLLKAQLCSLAETGLDIYLKRKSYLLAVSNSDVTKSNELSVLDGRYTRARSAMIHPLLSIGKQGQVRAFRLAEDHRDFRTLVNLCNEKIVGDQTNHRLDQYVQRFGKPFAHELYRWFIENGHHRTLLEQHYTDLLSDFLSVTDNKSLSWIHDLKLGNYEKTSRTLEILAADESKLNRQKFMFSLGKLSWMADKSEQDILNPVVQTTLEERFDDHLDLVRVQDSLRENMSKVLEESSIGGNDLDTLAENTTEITASRLHEYGQFRSVFTSLIKRLFTGDVLSVEEMVDLLTLQDPLEGEESARGFSTAFQVFARAQGVPSLRLQDAVRTFWKRVLLSSDWRSLTSTASRSDHQVEENLRSTNLYKVMIEHAFEQLPGGTFSLKEGLNVGAENWLGVPSEDGLKGRMKGLPEHRLDLLKQDYEREDDELRELMDEENGVGLNGWWMKVARLAQVDLENEHQDTLEDSRGEIQEEDSMMEQ